MQLRRTLGSKSSFSSHGKGRNAAVRLFSRRFAVLAATVWLAELLVAASAGAAQLQTVGSGLSSAQRASLVALGIKIALPELVLPGFHVEKVTTNPCPADAKRAANGTCRFGPDYAVVYRNAEDQCYAVEETGGGIGGVTFTYAFEVATPLFGNLAVRFGSFTSAQPKKPSAQQVAAPQPGLFTDWAGGAPFYRVIGTDWSAQYVGDKPGQLARLCRHEIAPARVADIVRSLRWLPTFKQTTCAYDPSSGVPNPFGMRAYLRITGDASNAVATYDIFPSMESFDNVKATIEERRQLRVYNVGVSGARRYLATHPQVYHDLIGYDHPSMSYPEFDKHLTCKSDP
jgi:hypothetical protein